MKIRELSISARSKACLLSAGCENLEDLRNVTDGELLEIRNLNRKCVAEIRKAIEDYFQEDLNELEIYFDEEDIKSDVLSMSIEDLEFDVRTHNCLKRSGINTLRELCEMSLDDILHLGTLGRKSLKNIFDKLDELGVSLNSVKSNENKQDERNKFTEKCYQVYQDSSLKVEVEEAYWHLNNAVYTPFLKVRITNISEYKIQRPSVQASFYNLLDKSCWGNDVDIESSNAKQSLRPGYSRMYTLKSENGYEDKVTKESLPEISAQLFVNNHYYGVVEIEKSYRASAAKPIISSDEKKLLTEI